MHVDYSLVLSQLICSLFNSLLGFTLSTKPVVTIR